MSFYIRSLKYLDICTFEFYFLGTLQLVLWVSFTFAVVVLFSQDSSKF